MQLNFIIGRGRSGTTLLSKILNKHINIVSTPENLFVLNLYKKYRNIIFQDDKDKLTFFDDLWLESNMYNWELDQAELKKHILSLSGALTFAEICKAVYEYYSFQKNIDAEIMFDKNPGYSLFLNELIMLYPEARFIHIVRNCKDNVLSYQNVPFEPNNIYTLAYRWQYYNTAIESKKSDLPHKFITLKYEDLVENPEPILREICDFIGVEYNESMLKFHEKGEESKQGWHSNLSQPLSKRNVDKWRMAYSEEEIARMDLVCFEMMNTYGYETDANQNTLLTVESRIMIFYGYILSRLEIVFFKIPLGLRTSILNLYRKFNR